MFQFTRPISIPVGKEILKDKEYKPLVYALLMHCALPHGEVKKGQPYNRAMPIETVHKAMQHYFSLSPQKREKQIECLKKYQLIHIEEDLIIFHGKLNQTYVKCEPTILTWFFKEYKNKDMLIKLFIFLAHRYTFNINNFSNSPYMFTLSGGDKSILAQLGYVATNNNNRVAIGKCLKILEEKRIVRCSEPQTHYNLYEPQGKYRTLYSVQQRGKDIYNDDDIVWVKIPIKILKENNLLHYAGLLEEGESND